MAHESAEDLGSFGGHVVVPLRVRTLIAILPNVLCPVRKRSVEIAIFLHLLKRSLQVARFPCLLAALVLDEQANGGTKHDRGCAIRANAETPHALVIRRGDSRIDSRIECTRTWRRIPVEPRTVAVGDNDCGWLAALAPQ